MGNRALLWAFLLCLVAGGALVVIKRQLGSRPPEAQGPVSGEVESAPEPAATLERGPSQATPMRPRLALAEAQTNAPGSGSAAPVQTPPVQRAADPAAGTSPAGGTLSTGPLAALSPDQPAERGAELYTHPELIQQNLRTNFVRAMQSLANAKSEGDRYRVLNDAAKLAFVFGKSEEARAYANELLALDQKFQSEPWRGGDAVHDGNLVLGRIAVQEGRIEDAKKYLLEAAASKGSPVLSSFGPNLSLARDLLQAGETETVVRYLDLCRDFWKLGGASIAAWTEEIKGGRVPDFGANLIY